MVLTTLAFTAMIGLVKVARAELSAAEVVFWRGFVGIPIAALGLRGLRLAPANRPVLALRIGLGFCAMICFFTAAKGLPLADHALYSKLHPLLVGILAPLALGAGERPGSRTWGALVFGLVGCGVLLGPEVQGGGLWGLWALAAAAFSAGAHVCLRRLGETDHPAVVVLCFQLAIAPLSLLLVLVQDGGLPGLPPVELWPVLAGVAVFAVLGQTMMTRAYQLDRAAVVAGAAYTSPLWAGLADAVFFETLPSWTTLVGGMLIVGSGLAVILQEDPEPASPVR